MAKSVNPILKKIIQNMELDLGSELNRFEENQDSDPVIILPVVETKTDDIGSFSSTSSLSYNPSNVYDEAIPVASRLIGDRTSLLDLILTTWGISGIILFFTANLFIFLNFEQLIGVNNQEKIIKVEEIIPEQNNQEEEIITSEINQESNSINSVKKEEKKPTEKPNIPPQLPPVENRSSADNQRVLPPSPHKNLETALWQEIQQKNSSPLPSNLSSTPISPLPQPSTNSNIGGDKNTLNQPNQEVNTPDNSPPVPNIPQKFYVVTEYENMDKYNRVRSNFPDAYLMNIQDKMTINLGVFSEEKEALQQSKKIESQGIKTNVVTVDTHGITQQE